MTVELDHELLTRAASRAEDLASRIRTNAQTARQASPVHLPSLDGIEEKAAWLEEQATMLYGLADVAFLLDDSGQVSLPMDAIRDGLEEALGSYLTFTLGNSFGLGDSSDFPLIEIALGLSTMRNVSTGVAPVWQTGLIGQPLLRRLLEKGGQSERVARWLLAGGGRRQALPKTLPPFMKGPLSKFPWFASPGSTTMFPTGGWGDPLSKSVKGGLGVFRGLGVAGGVVSTASGINNLYQQGWPHQAFKRDKAGYVSDVASTAFSASSTAFLVAPTPVTGAIVIGTGVVWAGAEVVDHWDDISDAASKGWDKVGDTASKGWDKVTSLFD